MIERQEIYCHNCNNYVQFNIDLELNGNHILKCPECGHEHCRVVKNGIITDDRWSSRNNNYNISISTITTSTTSVYITMQWSSTNSYVLNSWCNSTSVTKTG